MVSYDYRCVSANNDPPPHPPAPLFLVGMCRLVIYILTLFQTKSVIFHTHFHTRGPFLEAAGNYRAR